MIYNAWTVFSSKLRILLIGRDHNMIEIKNLVKRYGSKYAVDDVSFKVNKGEIGVDKAALPFISGFEYAEYLINYVLYNAPQEIVDKYYYSEVIVLGKDANGEEMKVSAELMMYYYRRSYASLLDVVTIDANDT